MRPDRSKRQIGLLAPEMATLGGVQSFMQRISEVIGGVMEEDPAVQGYCFSLNDSTEALRQHPAIPANLHVWGAARSKRRLITHALTTMPRTDVLFVGHLGTGPLAYLMKRLGRVRDYHVILHGIEAWEPVAPLDRRALMGATRIIATTRYTAEECARHNAIPADRFEVIPLCADERQVSPSPTFRLNGGFKLLCVARQAASERYKGFEHVFAALARLRSSHPQIHFNLVGDGDDQPRLKADAAERGVEDSVTFWGRLSDAELAAAYQQCDVFVMPSSREGFGIVFLEAMRHAKPCIGGDHGGTPDVIEHGQSGYLVAYGDVDALVDNVRGLVNDVFLRHSMGETGKKAVSDRFAIQHFNTSYQCLM
jgi:phosphatidylinositol alpha-1,6-mannosyltransferase